MKHNIALIWAIGILMIATAVEGAITDDLSIYFSLNNNETNTTHVFNVVDYTKNATFTGATRGASGISGEAFSFDGTDDEIQQADADYDSSQTITIVLWVKDLSDDDDQELIFGDGTAGTGDGGISIDFHGTNNDIMILGSADDGGNFDCVASSVELFTLLDGNSSWTQIIAGHNTTHCFLGWNGQIQNTTAITTAIVDGNVGDPTIGQRPAYNDYDLDGDLDEIGVWTRELTSEEISDLYTYKSPYLMPSPETTETYNENATEESSETIKALFENYNMTENSTATLNYNNTEYSGTLTLSNSSYGEFEYNVTTPWVYNNETNIEFYWEYLIMHENGSNTTGNLTAHNQTISWNLTETPRVNITLIDTLDDSVVTTATFADSIKQLSTTTGSAHFYETTAGTYEISATSSGYEDAVENVTFTSGEYGQHNISTYKIRLRLYFYYPNGTAKNVSGYIADTNFTQSFTDVSAVYEQRQLQLGVVNVFIAMNNTITNYTQYYEYINTRTTDIEQNITIIENATDKYWFRIIDPSNRPISDATVRLSYGAPSSTATIYYFAGQRLSKADGYVTFYANPNTHLLIEVIRDGYTYTRNLTGLASDITATEDLPYNIYLQRTDTPVDRGVYLQIDRTFKNRSEDIYGAILAMGRSTAEYTTDYRISQGSLNGTITLNTHDIGYFSLLSGTDFNTSGESNITLYLYLDEELFNTYTITYQTKNETITTEPAGISTGTKRFFAGIILILLSSLTGMLFGTVDEETGQKSGKIGTNIFMVGCMLYPVIAGTGYWLTIIIAIYYALTQTRRIFSE